jgi:hypothetical protein
MILNSKHYSTKFGIRIDRYNPFVPSKVGILLLIGVHLGAIGILWCLPWGCGVCLIGTLLIGLFAMEAVERYIFALPQYQVSFFFEDQQGWMIQENEKACYRGALSWAFCSHCLVILVFRELVLETVEGPVPKNKWKMIGRLRFLVDYGASHLIHPTLDKRKLVLPIFFDSLPPEAFRQLRKVLILSSYA